MKRYLFFAPGGLLLAVAGYFALMPNIAAAQNKLVIAIQPTRFLLSAQAS